MEGEEEEESKWAKVGYYEILGIEPNATAEEIKKAYRKRARQCHPDKNVNNNNNADPEEIKRVIEAKEVLMDPETRNFYDMYGEEGVAFHRAWKEAKPNEMLRQMGAGGICCFCCTNTVCVLFLLLFPILLCVKVSAQTDWLWGFVFSPLWIIDTIVILMLCVWPLLPVNVSKGDPLSSVRWDWLLQSLAFVCFQVFICIKLDGMNWSWAVVFVPMYVFQAMGTGMAIYEATQYEAAARVKKAGSTCGLVVWILYLFVQQALWWALWVAVQMKMDGILDWSWWIILSPAFGICAFWLFSSTRTPIVLSNDKDEKAYEQAFSRWKFGVTVILLLVTVLGALLAEGTDGFTVWAVWAPIYTASVLFVCALCTTSVNLCRQESDAEDGMQFDEEEGGTPRDTDPLHPEHHASDHGYEERTV